MSERIEEQRLINMRRGVELRNKDLARAHQNKEFAAKMLALTKDLTPKHQLPVPMPTKKAARKELEEPKREESKAQKKSDVPKHKSARKQLKGSIKESDTFFQQAASLGTKEREGSIPAEFAARMPLPLPVINELVDRIYKSKDTIGAQTLTIELKNTVLCGAQIQLSVTQGLVHLRFSTDDAKTKRLLKNSQSIITDRLFEKSLLLSDFIVS